MRILSALVLFVNVFFTIKADCPQPELLYPCDCEGSVGNLGNIYCHYGDYSIKFIFQALSKSITSESNKHFDRFYLTGSNIEEFEDNVFGNITFKDILIDYAYNLRRISAHAFDASVDTLESFVQTYGSKIGENSNGYELFKTLSSFNNLKIISLPGNEIPAIPPHAFSNSKQTKLEFISLSYNIKNIPAGYGTIKSIGNYAFSALTNLRDLDLFGQAIDYIPKHAFDFNTPSNETLHVKLGDTLLNSSSFESGVFLNSQRPLNLTIYSRTLRTPMNFLDEKIFAPFLRLDKRNFITFSIRYSEHNCDCRSYWLIKDRAQFKDQMNLDIRCPNHKDTMGTPIWEVDESLFAHCK